MHSSEIFNCKVSRYVRCCTLLTRSAFVMRRSSVRFWLWAYTSGCFGGHYKPIWHANGTLNSNYSQLTTHSNLSTTPRSKNGGMDSFSHKSLFECAFRVPQNQSGDTTTREINDLGNQNIALSMRCCDFLALYVSFRQFLKETHL